MNLEEALDAAYQTHLRNLYLSEDEIRSGAAVHEALKGTRFALPEPCSQYGFKCPELEIKQEDVVELVQTIGPIRERKAEMSVRDRRKHIVCRVFRPTKEELQALRIKMEFKLKRSDKCKIRTVKDSYTTLVCES